jgi:hypothetical protein
MFDCYRVHRLARATTGKKDIFVHTLKQKKFRKCFYWSPLPLKVQQLTFIFYSKNGQAYNAYRKQALLTMFIER